MINLATSETSLPPTHVRRYNFFGHTILIKYSDGVMMPSEFSKALASRLPVAQKSGLRALDMGSGSGIQGIILAKLGWSEIVAIDHDKRCLAATEFNALLNGVSEYSPDSSTFVTAVHSDSFERIRGLTFDLIVCNPPTLPTTDETPAFSSGGPTGREFLESLIFNCRNALKQNGSLLFVQSSLADIELTRIKLEEAGFTSKFEEIKKMPIRDYYMPHLFFYRRQSMLTGRQLYHEDGEGNLGETLYIIEAELQSSIVLPKI